MRDGYVTRAEVEAKYPGEWVALDQPTTDRFGNVTGGRLICHDPDRKAISRATGGLPKPSYVGIFYVTGPDDANDSAIEITRFFEDEWSSPLNPAPELPSPSASAVPQVPGS
jgi:hypothetical protein